MCVMKSVGLHVAADALAIGNLAGAHPDGGVVVVMGDDPWSDSTQVPADSRFLCKHLFMPILEPSTNQEMKDWVDLAFQTCRARASSTWASSSPRTRPTVAGPSRSGAIIFLASTRTTPSQLDTSKVDFEKNGPAPAENLAPRAGFPGQRYERLWASARQVMASTEVTLREAPRNRAKHRSASSAPVSPISYLEHALATTRPHRHPSRILKLGVTYPLDPTLIDAFADKVENVVVVEETPGIFGGAGCPATRSPRDDRANRPSPFTAKCFPADAKVFPPRADSIPRSLLEVARAPDHRARLTES